ncbi:MAG: Cadmium resistance transcriptional regulatory protein CadC [Candidatus Izimaplasma bacterium HR2]|jgi:ArsR family transcriptional regulator|nr:MAG: Cadmium resistance transcriptional regulatory protein CadC [Candidatus Izimaplasma bacterium HR2]
MDKYLIIKLLAEENRFNIFMKLLEYGELCVCEIEELLRIKQANTSKHLSKFKELNILSSKREGNLIKYSIKEEFLDDNMDLIKYLMI